MSKAFTDLEEREILALAIALEEEDSRIYRDFAEKLKVKHSAIASILEAMSAEESAHRARLLETYKLEYGDHIPFVRRPASAACWVNWPMPRRTIRILWST